MKRRGLTLLEVLVSMAIAGLLAVAVSTAFSAAVRYQLRAPQSRDAHLAQVNFENRIRGLLSRAFVDDDAANENTSFVGRVNEAGGGTGREVGATELIFTILGERPAGGALDTTEQIAFEDRNDRFGPTGGAREIRLGMTPLGDAGDRAGLFVREQTPPDDNIEEGGFESVLDDRVSSVEFEFWDGTEWLTEWDTRNGDRRIPGAILVTYSLSDDPDTQHKMVVRLATSDVTTSNPITGGGL